MGRVQVTGAPLLVGIDAGTTRIRTLVFTPIGKLVAEGSAPNPIEITEGSRSDFDPEALWRATVASVRQAVEQIGEPSTIRGIAVASVGESGIALDASHQVVARALAWYDQSPLALVEALAGKLDLPALHEKTGTRLSVLAGLCKMLWLRQHDPQAFAKTRHWLNVADFIAFRLCGAMATDFTLAGRMACLDLVTGDWDRALLDSVDISPAVLPPVRDSGAPLGTVRTDVARATGLPADCMVSVGGHDHIIGALASGVFSTGAMLDSLGTAEALLLPMPAQASDPRIAKWGLVQSQLRIGGKAHWFICGDLATSGASIEWFRKLFNESRSYDELMRDATAVEPGAGGVLFLPHLRIGSPPDRHPVPSGAFLNLSADTGQAVLYRAVLEGLAFDTRNIRDHMLALLPPDARSDTAERQITIIGGGSQNALLLDIKAAAFDCTLSVVQSKEAVSQGAALLAGLGCGIFRDPAAAVASLNIPVEELRPDAALSACYEKIFKEKFKPSVAAFRNLQK